MLAFLDLPGGYSIADVVANMRRLDRDLLDASVPRHASGVRRPRARATRLEEADRIDAERDLRRVHPRSCASTTGTSSLDGLRGFDDSRSRRSTRATGSCSS